MRSTLWSWGSRSTGSLKRLSPSDRTTEHCSSLYTSTTHDQKPIYSGSFYSVHQSRRSTITRHTDSQTTQCEEKEQASETCTAGVIMLSDQETNTTLVNMLQALTEKAESIREQVGNGSRDGNPKNWKEMLAIKNSVTQMRNSLMGFLVNGTHVREESLG